MCMPKQAAGARDYHPADAGGGRAALRRARARHARAHHQLLRPLAGAHLLPASSSQLRTCPCGSAMHALRYRTPSLFKEADPPACLGHGSRPEGLAEVDTLKTLETPLSLPEQAAVDMAVRAHEQACLLPEGTPPAALPPAGRAPGRARVGLLSQVHFFSKASTPLHQSHVFCCKNGGWIVPARWGFPSAHHSAHQAIQGAWCRCPRSSPCMAWEVNVALTL